MKAGRGHGKRGGVGNAGLHKHRFVYMLKYMPDHFGRHGFVRHHDGVKEDVTVNVKDLLRLAGGESVMDLGKMGFTKLLGAGSIDTAIEVTVSKATTRAVEKIEAAGGKVTIEGEI